MPVTKEFRRKFKENLGEKFEYTPKVSAILEEKKITNRNKKPYSSYSIRNVFAGLQNNIDIELAIFDVYENAIQTKDKLEQRRNKYRDR